MKVPEVSVIILCYNQEDTVGRAIDSVLSQRTDFPVEIVVGDDCSTDGTVSVCREYAAKYPNRITVVEGSHNRGVVGNYRETLLHCRGRFIADCAGDDYWTGETMLQRKYEIIKSDGRLSLVHTSWYENREDQPVSPQVELTPRATMEALLGGEGRPAVHLSTALYRADMLFDALKENELMVFDEMFGCEDLPLLCALLNRGGIAYIDEPSLVYMRSGNSISDSGIGRREAEYHLKTAAARLRLAEYYGINSPRVKRAVSEKTAYAIGCAVMTGDSVLRNDVLKAVRENSLPKSWRFVLKKMVSATPWGWRLYLKLKK